MIFNIFERFFNAFFQASLSVDFSPPSLPHGHPGQIATLPGARGLGLILDSRGGSEKSARASIFISRDHAAVPCV